MLEHIPPMSLDSIEGFGEVDPDNSSEDLKHMDSPEVEVHSSESTSCQSPNISLKDFD